MEYGLLRTEGIVFLGKFFGAIRIGAIVFFWELTQSLDSVSYS